MENKAMTDLMKNMADFYKIHRSSWIVACLLLLTVIFYALTHNKITHRMLKSFNHAPSLPIIGSLHLLRGNMKERISKMLNLLNKYELPLVAWVMNIPAVFIGKYDDIQTVLNKSDNRDLLGAFDRMYGDSLFQLQGEKWHRRRRIVTPLFSSTMMRQYFPVINQYSALLLETLEPFSDTDNSLDISSYVFKSNLFAVTKNVTGYGLETREEESTRFMNAFSKVVKMESMRLTSPLLLPELIYKVYLFFSGNNKLYEDLRQLPKSIVRHKLMNYAIDGQNEVHENNLDTGAKGGKILIDTLLSVHMTDADFTEKHIHAEILETITAGYETTSSTICFVLLMLAMHPEAQEQVYDEIKTVLGGSDREVQMEDIENLIYMGQCINETLRKFPTIPLTTRRHHEDIALNDKQIIPAGCLIFVAFYVAHHDKQFFPNADNWDPSHFASPAFNHAPFFSPFGSGKRPCIGAKYATLTMKIQLVHLLRRYHFTTDMKMKDIHLTVDLAMRNESGYWLKLYSRQKSKNH